MPADHRDQPRQPTVLARTETILSPWVRLVTRTVAVDGEVGDFHAFAQADYVSVLATDEDGAVVLVRQFRPAVDGWTLELPGGLRDGDEDPASAAARELFEETGFEPVRPLVDLGWLQPDVGRLENRMWCYAAIGARRAPGWSPERGVESVLVRQEVLADAIISGDLRHALHLALIGIAVVRGLLPDLVASPHR